MKIRYYFTLNSGNYAKALFSLFTVYCLVHGTASGQAYPYKFHYLTVDEGLSHTDANDIAQDKQGYIWIATYFGIDRYDGYSVKKFYNNNSPVNNAFKNRVRCIYPDDTGNIWLGTENGLQCFNAALEKYMDFDEVKKERPIFERLYKPSGELLYGLAGGKLKIYQIRGASIEEQQVPVPKDVSFSNMAHDQSGLLYLSSNKGLWTLNKSGEIKHVTITGISEQALSLVYFDNHNNLLVASCNVVFLFDKSQLLKTPGSDQTFKVDKRFSFSTSSCIKKIVEDKKADYWVSTRTDLLRVDTNATIIQVINNQSSSQSLNSNTISGIFIDRSECLWVYTFGGGVNYCDLNEKLFYTLQHDPEVHNSLSGNHIRSVLEDKEELWIGTTANGLNRYNIKTQTFSYFNTYNTPVKLKSDVISALAFDDNQNLWIGSAAGIEILKPGRKELWKPPGYDQFPTYMIETIVKDCYGNMWFGNHTDRFGVIWKDEKKDHHVKYYGEGYFILADKSKPQLFVSSTHGLKRLIIDEKGNVNKTVLYTASSKSNSLSSNYTYPISMQNDSTYWIGTIGGGVNRLLLHKNDSYSITSYTGRYGVFNDVESLEIDNEGKIWMGGNGLECLNPSTGKLVRYDKNDGLQGNSFKVGSSYKGADGKLYFGGINGLNYFYPDQIRSNNIAATPILTDILINNQEPRYGNADSSENSLPQAISYCKDITLNYLQNNFVISFSAMHFVNPLKCRYRYKLIGFD